jgi:hypothetical protein
MELAVLAAVLLDVTVVVCQGCGGGPQAFFGLFFEEEEVELTV